MGTFRWVIFSCELLFCMLLFLHISSPASAQTRQNGFFPRMNRAFSTSPSFNGLRPRQCVGCQTVVSRVQNVRIVSNPVVSRSIIVSRPTVSRPVTISRPIVSHPIVSHPIVSHPIVSHPIVSHPIVSHPIVSHPIVSHPIVSNPIVYNPIVRCGIEC